ncbi:MAG: zinc ribbon domain-containing protein, partial [Bacteroidota bacterium]
SRADLPRQINSVKLEVESLNSENTTFLTNAGELQMRIGAFKEVIKGAENSIKDFKKQLSKTKGTEKDYIEKEIEFQELEIELQKKHIRLAEQDLKECNKEIASLAAKIKERESDLKMKEKMLSKLISETEAEENALLTKLNDQRKRIDSHLLERYDRLRKSTTNGLAVVPVERDASTGSFIQIPTQIKMNVQARKRIMTDEHSGRILVDDILAREEEHFLNLSLKKLKK